MSSKNYLDKNGLTYFWGKVKDEVESIRSMCVHITYNSTSEQYESDKTFSEISSAYKNGSNVFADLGGTRYALFSCYSYDNDSRGSVTFSVSDIGNSGYGIVVGGSSISIIKDGSGESVTVGSYTNATIPAGSTSTDGLPSMDGTAYRGDSFNFARADHVHPSDTSKANTSDVLTKTNTTSYTPSANYHPATKKYVDDKEFNDLSDVFIIECTTENNTPVVDKTWTEITTAYNAGKKIFAKHESSVFPLTKFFQSNSSLQGYVAFYSPSPSFNPNLNPYYGGLWRFGEYCIVVWDTTWSGQDGKMVAWDTAFLPEVIPMVTWYEDQNDSNNYCLQRINNDSGQSIFMDRYDPNCYSSFVIGSSGINITSTAYDPYGSNSFVMGSSGVSIASTAGVSIQNLVTPTNNTDAATKEYVDSATNGITTNLSGLTDTTITSPSSGQVLSYDSTNSKWVNADTPAIKAGTGDSAVIINDYYNLPCVASGDGALSEGGATTASGTVSHSEGQLTIAGGNYSHAENMHTFAYGVGSHSEGGVLSGNITISGAANATTYTVDSGCPRIYGTAADIAIYVELYYNNVYYYPTTITISDEVITSITLESTLDENNALNGTTAKLYFRTVAKGKGSHAEGGATYTHAEYSHAEGKQTHTAGKNSHSEGLLTIAASDNQHVQGKNNIVDSAGTYAHIVGNGTSSSARSNAHTLDWNGNGWYAGKLTVGTAPTNNMDVATKQYVDSNKGSSLYVVNITQDAQENYSADKTYSEIMAHYNAGDIVVARYSIYTYTLSDAYEGVHFINANENGTTMFSISTEDDVNFQSSYNTIANLFDTDVRNPSNGQILTYDNTSAAWVNADAPAIKSSTGEDSVIAGVVEDDSSATTYTLYLTGAANSRTYSYTTQDTLPTTIKTGSYVEYSNQYTAYTALIESIDTTNHSITLSRTFYDALSNAEVKIYYRYTNVAKGDYSFAEGRWTAAIGSYSHAEGSSTLAGLAAHAEGTRTSATGMSSHSENQCTSAEGAYSHSEGYYTIASSSYQHVQGKYNIEDDSGVYAHIVGNGTGSETRSNAHTLDWSGNSWYAGKVSAGTVASPASVTNANDLTTKAYVDNALSGVTDTNTTYTISISGNVITLTPSSGQAQSITLPVYDGSVSSS